MNSEDTSDGGGRFPPVEAGLSVEDEAGGETLRFSNTLRANDFLIISLKNGLLNIVTLTLYRFWGKTEVRRRIWQGVRLNDEAFEYTGRGIELFIGFLLALLVAAPALLLMFLAQLTLGRDLVIAIFGLLFLLYMALLYWLWGFGTFTAFRYMASRTTWRGIRFRLGGSATAYGLQYLGFLVLTGLTLGWYRPAGERRLAESVWDELRYGNRRVRFRMARADSKPVYGAYAIGWFGNIGLYFVFMIVMFGAMFAMGAFGADAPATPGIEFMLVMYGSILIVAPLYFLAHAPYQAAILRSIVAGITLGKAGFALQVKAIPLWWLTVSNLFLVLITFGFLMPWAQARTVRWITDRIVSAGEANLSDVNQTSEGPKSGEGLADAFGFSII